MVFAARRLVTGAAGVPCAQAGGIARSPGAAGVADGGQDLVQAEGPGLLDVAAEPERSRELHRDEPVRPGHDRARR
jgi:hypothetical protein